MLMKKKNFTCFCSILRPQLTYAGRSYVSQTSLICLLIQVRQNSCIWVISASSWAKANSRKKVAIIPCDKRRIATGLMLETN